MHHALGSSQYLCISILVHDSSYRWISLIIIYLGSLGNPSKYIQNCNIVLLINDNLTMIPYIVFIGLLTLNRMVSAVGRAAILLPQGCVFESPGAVFFLPLENDFTASHSTQVKMRKWQLATALCLSVKMYNGSPIVYR